MTDEQLDKLIVALAGNGAGKTKWEMWRLLTPVFLALLAAANVWALSGVQTAREENTRFKTEIRVANEKLAGDFNDFKGEVKEKMGNFEGFLKAKFSAT